MKAILYVFLISVVIGGFGCEPEYSIENVLKHVWREHWRARSEWDLLSEDPAERENGVLWLSSQKYRKSIDAICTALDVEENLNAGTAMTFALMKLEGRPGVEPILRFVARYPWPAVSSPTEPVGGSLNYLVPDALVELAEPEALMRATRSPVWQVRYTVAIAARRRHLEDVLAQLSWDPREEVRMVVLYPGWSHPFQ